MLLESSHVIVIIVKLIKGLIERKNNDFKKASLIFGKYVYVCEIFHEWSLRQTQLSFHFILITKL